MPRDGWTIVSSYLRAEEAELLGGLLESAGIEVMVEDAAISALNPLLQSAVGGAKVLVPAADSERAAGILAASGLFDGGPDAAGDIPEEEWSSGSAPDAIGPAAAPTPPVLGSDGELAAAERASRHALRAAFAAIALAGTLVLPLYAVVAAIRALRRRDARARRAGRRAWWALLASTVAVALGLALWSTVLPGLRHVQTDRPEAPPAQRPTRPFP